MKNINKRYYIAVHEYLLTEYKLTPKEALVFSLIKRREHKRFEDYCISQFEELGKILGMSERAVSSTCKKLQEKGFLHIEKNRYSGGSFRTFKTIEKEA